MDYQKESHREYEQSLKANADLQKVLRVSQQLTSLLQDLENSEEPGKSNKLADPTNSCDLGHSVDITILAGVTEDPWEGEDRQYVNKEPAEGVVLRNFNDVIDYFLVFILVC